MKPETRQNGLASLIAKVSFNAAVSVPLNFFFFTACLAQSLCKHPSSLFCVSTMNNVAPAATCPALTVKNGKASSTSRSKTMETVDITCDHGYKNSGKIPICTGDGPGKAAWTNIPTCEGRL